MKRINDFFAGVPMTIVGGEEKRVIGYFESSNQAGQAANELKNKEFKEISILGNENGGNEDSKSRDNNGMNISGGTMTGGAIGGLAGLGLGTGALGALGAAALLIPGVGPIVAMGPLAAALGVERHFNIGPNGRLKFL